MPSCFLYFVPAATLDKRAGWELADVGAVGLGYAFDRDGPIMSCQTHAGPDGGAGMVLARTDAADRCLFKPDEQTWRKIPGRPADKPVWVGFWNGCRPGPEELLRRSALAGHPVLLGDGQEWTCPTARAWDATSERWGERVSRTLDWDEAGGRILGDVVPTQRALWAAAQSWWDARLAADVEGEFVKFGQAVDSDTAVAALAHNYRLGRAEVGLLGLLDQRTEIQVLNALIDWPTFVEWSEKKSAAEAAGSKPDDGSPASIPATDPPASISG